MRRSAVLAGLAVMLLSAPAFAQQQPGQSTGAVGAQPSEEVANPGMAPLFSAPLGDQHLFGDWGGARTWLEDRGINVLLDYLEESAGNVSGGAREGFDYAGQVALEIDLDGGKLFGLPGFALHTMIVQGNGRSTSADYLKDDLDAVQEIYGSRGNALARMVYTYAEQLLDNNRIDLAAGWLPVGTYFASSPIYCDFMNVIICGNPHPLPVYPGEPDWPNANWGGQVRYVPTPTAYVMGGLFQVNPNFGGLSGWDWFKGGSTGVSIPLEVGWVPRFGPSGLIGHYKFGFDEDTSGYDNLFAGSDGLPIAITGETGQKQYGRRMYYVLADQMLMRGGKSDTAGLILFGGGVHADGGISPLSNHAFAGVIDTGAGFGRPQDTFGFMYNYFSVSTELTRTQQLEQELGVPLTGGGLGPANGVQTEEQTLELMYTAQVYHGVSVMPDVQYVIRPGATDTYRNAWVLGFRTNVQF